MFRKVDHQNNFHMYLMFENMKNCHINKFLTHRDEVWGAYAIPSASLSGPG